jgi:hypothetical protein
MQSQEVIQQGQMCHGSLLSTGSSDPVQVMRCARCGALVVIIAEHQRATPGKIHAEEITAQIALLYSMMEGQIQLAEGQL